MRVCDGSFCECSCHHGADIADEHRQLKEAVGSFLGFWSRGTGKRVLERSTPDAARRIRDYLDQLEGMVK